jgi:hypothetical protein
VGKRERRAGTPISRTVRLDQAVYCWLAEKAAAEDHSLNWTFNKILRECIEKLGGQATRSASWALTQSVGPQPEAPEPGFFFSCYATATGAGGPADPKPATVQ